MRMTTPEKKELDQRLTTRQPFFENLSRLHACRPVNDVHNETAFSPFPIACICV